MAEAKEGQPGAQETDVQLQQRLESERRKAQIAWAMMQAEEHKPDPPEPEVEVGSDKGSNPPFWFTSFLACVVLTVGFVLGWVAFGLEGGRLTTPIYEKSFAFERLGPLNREIWALRGKLQDAETVQGEWQRRARQLVGQWPTEVELSADVSGAIKITGADNVTIRDSTFTVTEATPFVEVK